MRQALIIRRSDITPLDPLLTVKGLKVYYFSSSNIVKAVDDVYLELLHNGSLGLAGESGCGKTTLGSALLRSIPPPGRIMKGSIVLDGKDISTISDREFDRLIRWKKIAMVFQGAMNSLTPVFTVGKQMKEILDEHRFMGNVSNTISESLSQVLLDDTILGKYPHELSGGQKQRIIIAMALLLKPQILVADEPTTSLDVIVQAQVINLFKRLKKNGLSIIFISHDLSVISELAETIGIMYAGQLVELGSTREVYSNPKHPYTQKLIATIPRIKDKNNSLQFLKGKPPDMADLHEGCRFLDRCSFAMEICNKDPPLFEYENVKVRCWLYK
jgi:peptide/nickel transport system ATP-binding protein